MTPYERENPDMINGSRKARIAKGSGQDVNEVSKMMKQFEDMRKMMKMMSNPRNMANMMGQMKNMR
jgi:signal recognition particle subunit SRP54